MAGERFPGDNRDGGGAAWQEMGVEAPSGSLEPVADIVGSSAERRETLAGTWIESGDLGGRLSERAVVDIHNTLRYPYHGPAGPRTQDFWAYCKENDEGDLVVHAAIGMDTDGRVGAVCSTGIHFNIIERGMSTVEAVEAKLKTLPGGDKFDDTIADMRWLTELYDRYADLREGQEFDMSIDDLAKLYHLFGTTLKGVGYGGDPRLSEIYRARESVADINRVFKDDKYQVVEGDITLSGKFTHSRGLELPKEVHGDISLKFVEAEGITFPEIFEGSVSSWCRTAKDLVFPKRVDGHLRFHDVRFVENITLPEELTGNCNFSRLETAESFVLPKSVGGGLDLFSLYSLEGVTLPESVGGSCKLDSIVLDTNEGPVSLPKKVGGELQFSYCGAIKGITFPEEVGGELSIPFARSIEGSTLPKHLGSLCLVGMVSAKGLLELPNTVNGHVGLPRLTSIEDITFPEEIKGTLDLGMVTRVENAVLPKRVGGMLDLGKLRSAKNLTLPEKVEGAIRLYRLTSIEGITPPKYVGGKIYAGVLAYDPVKKLLAGTGLEDKVEKVYNQPIIGP